MAEYPKPTPDGDEAASGQEHVEQCGTDYAWKTWENNPISEAAQRTKSSKSYLECAEEPEGVVSCSIWEDSFSSINTDDWTLVDSSNITDTGPNGFEHLVHPAAAPFGLVRSQGKFNVGGDFDTSIEFDITDFQGTSPNGLSKCQFQISEPLKGGVDVTLSAINKDSVFQYFLVGDGNVQVGIFDLTPPVTIGKHYFRFTRSGTTVTIWVWNPTLTRWEWDDNPAGWVHDGVWDENPQIQIIWGDTNTTDWIEGTVRKFCINAGTKIELP